MTFAKKFQAQTSRTVNALRASLDIPEDEVPEIGVILGTGWGDLLTIEDERTKPLSALPEFDHIGTLPGHKRLVCYGRVGGKRVIALRGRVHLNERPYHEPTVLAVRMQAQMMVELGVRTFIITNAAGALGDKCRVGDIVVVDGFFSLFMPPLPMFAGEFCVGDDVLDAELRRVARNIGHEILGKHDDGRPRVTEGGYVPVIGPMFEGRKYDKPFLRSLEGVRCVGMSSLPETAVIAKTTEGKGRVLVLSHITNTDTEPHSHETNVERAKANAEKLGRLLTQIIASAS